MNEAPTRRQLLAASGTAALLSSVTMPALAQSSDPCGKYRSMQEDMETDRTAVEELEAELSAVESDVRDLMTEIHRRREEVRGPHPFDASVRERALQVGLAARPAVVFIQAGDDAGAGVGTAWFVDEHLLLTNAHVADGIPELNDVWAFTLSREVGSVEVVETVESQNPDVALLRTDLSAPSTLSLASESDLESGDPLVQVGNSAGFWPWAISLGAFEKREDGDLVSTVPSRSGASGSPVLTLDGEVVGLHYAGSMQSDDFENLHPVPSDPSIEQFPLQPTARQSHVPGRVVSEKLEEWT